MLYPDFHELVQLKSKVSNLELPSNRLIKSAISGGLFSPFRGHGLEFTEVRKYVNGDDIRKIDWQVTARTNTPHIKLFTEERERTVLLLVDTNPTMSFGTRGTFKSIQAARCAALLGWCANKSSNFLGAVLFGGINKTEYFKPTRTRRSLWKMLQYLSRSETKGPKRIIELNAAMDFTNKKASPSSLVFIISDFINIDDQLKTQLTYLNNRCQVVLISINDPSDQEIITIGDVLFSSDKVNCFYVDTKNIDGRNAYKKQWENRSLKLKNMATNLGIHTISLSTDRDIFFDLCNGLKSFTKYRKK